MAAAPADLTGNVTVDAKSSLIVTTRDGLARELLGREGSSVMEIIRDAGINEVPAFCGGACSCASCHVHVAPEWMDKLPSISDDEAALLEEANNHSAHSRLSCQIPFSPAIAGLRVTVAYAE